MLGVKNIVRLLRTRAGNKNDFEKKNNRKDLTLKKHRSIVCCPIHARMWLDEFFISSSILKGYILTITLLFLFHFGFMRFKRFWLYSAHYFRLRITFSFKRKYFIYLFNRVVLFQIKKDKHYLKISNWPIIKNLGIQFWIFIKN